MKILGVYNHSEKLKDDKLAPVDIWRVRQTLENSSHEVKLERSLLKDLLNKSAVSEDDLQRNFKRLKGYDLIWSSYYTNPSYYSFARTMSFHGGPRAVVDVDDNLFEVNVMNPYRVLVADDHKRTARIIVEDTPVLITTNEDLKARMNDFRPKHDKDSIFVLPNYIDMDKHGVREPEDKVFTIAWWGGASHWSDLHDTGLTRALKQFLKGHRNVKLKTVGMPLEHQMPAGQYEYVKGGRDEEWYRIYKDIKADIALGPLTYEVFNRYKTEIKWMEASLMGAAFIASDMGPYKRAIEHGKTGILVKNTKAEWLNALNEMYTKKQKRLEIAKNAQAKVIKDHVLQNNQKAIDDVIQKVHDYALKCKDYTEVPK